MPNSQGSAMAPMNLIGKPTPLVDGPVKVSGSAEYVADIRIPGIFEGKVLRSPHAHARILNIDVEKARRAPGVYAVITAADTPDQDWGVTDLKDQPDRSGFHGECELSHAGGFQDEPTGPAGLHVREGLTSYIPCERETVSGSRYRVASESVPGPLILLFVLFPSRETHPGAPPGSRSIPCKSP